MANVLAIDDHDMTRSLLRDILAVNGHATIAAGDAVEGLALVQRHVPDLVIADLVLPGMDGLELIRQLKAEYPNLPILAISGACFSSNFLALATEAGANRCLAKPFSAAALLRLVDELVGSVPTPAELTFLLLDDEPDQRYLNCWALRRVFPKCSFIECETSEEALFRCEEQPVDAVLADHHLGQSSGTDLIRELRRRHIECPIMMVTGNSDPKIREQALANGANAVFGPSDGNFAIHLRTLIRGHSPSS